MLLYVCMRLHKSKGYGHMSRGEVGKNQSNHTKNMEFLSVGLLNAPTNRVPPWPRSKASESKAAQFVGRAGNEIERSRLDGSVE